MAAATTTLALGDDLALPVDFITRRTAIVGQTDTGKTSTAVVTVEEARRAGAQVVVIDPSGAWWGVTSSADGEGPGLDMVVMGGEHGDVPLNESAGVACAHLVAEEGMSVVLDLDRPHFKSWAARQRFVADFLSELYEVARSQILIVIDEAHRFAPQAVREEGGDVARCLGAVVDVVALGRRRGLAVIAITQRLAKLHKDVLELCEVFIAHRLRGNNDRAAAKGWLEAFGEAVKPILTEIARLEKGIAHVSAPTLGIEGVYRIRPKDTFDSSRTIDVGEVAVEPKVRSEVDMTALAERMAETIERQKAEDPRALRRRIKELEAQQADLEAQLADRPETAAEPQLVWPFTGEEFDQAIDDAQEAVARAREAGAALDEVVRAVKDTGEFGERALAALRSFAERKGEEVAALDKVVNVGAGNLATRGRPPAPRPAPNRAPSAEASNGDGPTLKAGARRILETLARHHPMRFTRAQVGTLTGFKVTGGTFQTYWGVLKRAGYVEEAAGEIVVTDAGLDRAGVVPEAPATTGEMVAMWGERLKKGAREMLDCLVEAHPQALARDELAERVGMTASGGTFQTYLGTLRRNGLAETADGEVRASEVLFISGSVA